VAVYPDEQSCRTSCQSVPERAQRLHRSTHTLQQNVLRCNVVVSAACCAIVAASSGACVLCEQSVRVGLSHSALPHFVSERDTISIFCAGVSAVICECCTPECDGSGSERWCALQHCTHHAVSGMVQADHEPSNTATVLQEFCCQTYVCSLSASEPSLALQLFSTRVLLDQAEPSKLRALRLSARIYGGPILVFQDRCALANPPEQAA
jgi:hypothetical protein